MGAGVGTFCLVANRVLLLSNASWDAEGTFIDIELSFGFFVDSFVFIGMSMNQKIR